MPSSPLAISAPRPRGIAAAPARLRAAAPATLDWRHEAGLFAADEIGWLLEEAQRHADAAGAPLRSAARLSDPHLAIAAFARLAHHPRLLDYVESRLGASVALAQTVLHRAAAVALAPSAADDEIAVIVPLGWRPEMKRGDVVVGRSPSPPPWRFDFPVVLAYRIAAAARYARERDDCLWPSPWVVAG